MYIPQSTRDLIARMKSDPACVISRDPALHGREIVLARAPGRLDVMGGIADYTGSLVCEMPLDLSTAVAVQRRDDRAIAIQSYNAIDSSAGGGRPAGRVEFSLDDLYGTAALLPAETVRDYFPGEKRWAAYVAGAYWVLAKHRKLTRRTSGANIVCHSNVPLGAGLGSSAALEVAALSAITSAYHLILDPLETAILAQHVENLIVGAPCGLMDQVTSMMGRKGKLLLMECRPHTVKGHADIPAGLMLCGINSGVRHATHSQPYRNTRVAAFMAHAIIVRAYHDLGFKNDPTSGYLANITPEIYFRYLRRLLPTSIGGAEFTRVYGTTADKLTHVSPQTEYTLRDAADHHIMENARVVEFVDMLEQAAAGSEDALFRAGRLMVASHHSYSLRAHLGSKETDLLVKLIMRRGPRNGLYGAKITGAGSGGTVAILCDDSEKSRTALADIQAEYQKQSTLAPSLLTGSSEGAAETGPLRLTTAELFS